MYNITNNNGTNMGDFTPPRANIMRGIPGLAAHAPVAVWDKFVVEATIFEGLCNLAQVAWRSHLFAFFLRAWRTNT